MPTETRIELVIACLLAVAIVVYECLTAALRRCWTALGERVARPGRAAKRRPPWPARRHWWRRLWPVSGG